jgi:hypothetical protein
MRFGDLPWADCPFDWHRVREASSTGEPDSLRDPWMRIVLRVALLDSTTSIVKALRLMTWSPEFSAAVINSMRRQAELPDNDIFERKRVELYSRTTSEDIARMAFIRCWGGS